MRRSRWYVLNNLGRFDVAQIVVSFCLAGIDIQNDQSEIQTDTEGGLQCYHEIIVICP